MGFLDLKHETVGLDIGDSSVKIAKLKKTRRGFKFESFNSTRIAPGIVENGIIKNEDSLAKIIKFLLETAKGKKIKTKYIVASLPEEKSFLHIIPVPEMSFQELKLAVPLEAENYIPMSADDLYLDFEPISPVKNYLGHTEVLAAAIPKNISDSYVSCIMKAGLVPAVLELESQAISRALLESGENPSLKVFVDFGENDTIFLIYSGYSLRFSCTISISSKMLDQAISDALKVDIKEAERIKTEYGLIPKKNSSKSEKSAKAMMPIIEDLTRQIEKYLDFYKDHSSYEYLLKDKTDGRVFVCGGGAQLKGLVEFMANKMEMPVEMADPLVNIHSNRKSNEVRKDALGFTTAIGLALRQLENNIDQDL